MILKKLLYSYLIVFFFSSSLFAFDTSDTSKKCVKFPANSYFPQGDYIVTYNSSTVNNTGEVFPERIQYNYPLKRIKIMKGVAGVVTTDYYYYKSFDSMSSCDANLSQHFNDAGYVVDDKHDYDNKKITNPDDCTGTLNNYDAGVTGQAVWDDGECYPAEPTPIPCEDYTKDVITGMASSCNQETHIFNVSCKDGSLSDSGELVPTKIQTSCVAKSDNNSSGGGTSSGGTSDSNSSGGGTSSGGTSDSNSSGGGTSSGETSSGGTSSGDGTSSGGTSLDDGVSVASVVDAINDEHSQLHNDLSGIASKQGDTNSKLDTGVLKIPCQSDKIISRIDNERRDRF